MGSFMRVGSINEMLGELLVTQVDALHLIEDPPLGDTPLSGVKKIGDRVCFIGNLQIGYIYASLSQDSKTH